jgi:hypothetical protein
MSLPRWSPDGAELAYVEGSELKLWQAADGTTRTLRTLPEDFTAYRLVFGLGVVGYTGQRSAWLPQTLVVLDSRDGARLRTVWAPFNGGAFPLDGDQAVFEVGF